MASKRKVPALDEPQVAAFLRLVGSGDVAAVKAQLAVEPRLVNAVGPHPFWGGRPQPLHVAIETNRAPMVRLLLDAGAEVDGRNDQYAHWSPFMIALADGRARSRRALVRRGVKIGLAEALMSGDDRRALLLLRNRAALKKPVPNDGSWLALARTPAAIDRLLALGASTTARDRFSATPMESLSRQRKKGKALVRHLAARGVPVDAEAFARLGDRVSLARLIKADGADAAIVRRPTVVKAAVDFGHCALVAWLLDQGADVDARSVDRVSHDTCLHAAAWNGDLPMVELLLARGANPRLADDEHHGTAAAWADVAVTVTNNPRCAVVARRLRAAMA